MDYKHHYNLLIDRAKGRLLEGYTEKHHIIPKCMGGSNYKENIVKLTPEEHFVAHQLLVKMHPGNLKLLHAAHMMTVTSKSNQKRNNKMYGWLRKKRSEKLRQWALKNNIRPPDRTGTKHKEETKRKISEGTKGRKGSYSMLGKKGKDCPNYGSKRTEEQKRNMRASQQLSYQLTSPTGENFFFKSFELKKFCKDNQLSWSYLMRVKKQGRIIKNGWNLIEIPAIPKPIARTIKPDVDF